MIVAVLESRRAAADSTPDRAAPAPAARRSGTARCSPALRASRRRPRRELEPLPQHLADRRIGARRELEPHHRLVAALPDLLAHQVAQRLVRFLVDLHLGVARQAEQRRSGERHAAVQLAERCRESLRAAERKPFALAPRPPAARSTASAPPEPSRAHRSCRPVRGSCSRKASDVGEVRKKRKRMRRIENQRRQRGRDLANRNMRRPPRCCAAVNSSQLRRWIPWLPVRGRWSRGNTPPADRRLASSLSRTCREQCALLRRGSARAAPRFAS